MVHGKLLKCAAAVSALCAALSASAKVVLEDVAKPGNSGDPAQAQTQTSSTQSQREGTTPTTTRETTTQTQSGMSASGAQQTGSAQTTTSGSAYGAGQPTSQSGSQYGTQSATQSGSQYGSMQSAQSGTQATTSPSVRTNGSKLPPSDARSREAMDAQSGVTSPTAGQRGSSATGATQAGQSGAAATAAGESTLSRADQKAIRDMAMANLSEVELGRMAQSRSSNDEVKAFAQQMIDDHGKALADVQALAQSKGVTLPAEPDARHKREADKLDKLSGDAFDKAYMARAGVADHKTTYAHLGKIKSSARDADVKAAADAMRPVVQQHLNAARQLNARVKSGKKEDSGAAAE